MIFPFHLKGPEFLFFYSLFCGLLMLGLWASRRARGSIEPQKVHLTDPYLIAYLRGGEKELIGVTLISLIDRSLASIEKEEVIRNVNSNQQNISPLDLVILTKIDQKDLTSALAHPTVLSICSEYQGMLENYGLAPNREDRSRFKERKIIAIGLALMIALIKVGIALFHGHTNIEFLLMSVFAFSALALSIPQAKITRKGKHFLSDLTYLYSGLRKRMQALQSGQDTGELPLLAAVYGIAVLPSVFGIAMRSLLPIQRPIWNSDTSDLDSDCSTSCGSSSCGSSCGGGCGGGCGGCGS